MLQPYQLTASPDTVLRVADQAFVPLAPGNRDFADYQTWLDAGNVPDPAPRPPINQTAQLTARVEYRARKLEKSGALLEAYALRNGL